METKLQNGLYGKSLETVILLPEVADLHDMGRVGKAELVISTSKKSSGAVQSHAGVTFNMADGSKVTRYPDDFGLFVKPKTIITRATEKGLQTVHAETLADIEAIKAQAIAHYNK